jgi:hypothetical protein
LAGDRPLTHSVRYHEALLAYLECLRPLTGLSNQPRKIDDVPNYLGFVHDYDHRFLSIVDLRAAESSVLCEGVLPYWYWCWSADGTSVYYFRKRAICEMRLSDRVEHVLHTCEGGTDEFPSHLNESEILVRFGNAELRKYNVTSAENERLFP